MEQTTSGTAQITELLQRLLERAARDPEQVTLLQQLALTILETFPVAPKPETQDLTEVVPVEATDEEIDAFIETFAAESHNDVVTPEPEPEVAEEIVFEKLPARLRLKARACHWLSEHGYTHDPAALSTRYRLIDEARATSCYLWMLDPDTTNPNTAREFGALAEAYDATATAIDLYLASVEPDRKLLELTATLQAGLRERASQARPAPSRFFDEDQKRVFSELRRYSQEQQVYLYGLALKDTIGPQKFRVALEHLGRHQEQWGARQSRAATRQKGLKQLSYHVQLLQRGSQNPEYDWNKVAQMVSALTRGVSPRVTGSCEST